jgi:molybdopterin synthase catalytic subunit
MSDRKPKNIFVKGAISPAMIGDSIAKHHTKTDIGGHSIFLGQVRADVINGKPVQAIEYTAHEAMALESMHSIREAIFEKYTLTCMHVYHSLGIVETGAICLFVFASSPHRQACMEACNEIVESIKKQLPIWGKEIFEDDSYQWKENH